MTKRLDDTLTHQYSRLKVWQSAVSLSVDIYNLTHNFPDSEKFGITNQLRRASVSVASNIAEGSKRGTKKDFSAFLRIALGSLAELDTQLFIAYKIKYISEDGYKKIHLEVTTLSAMIHAFIKKVLCL